MSALASRFPSARRLQNAMRRESIPSDGHADVGTDVDVFVLIEPYLDWMLLEVDTASTDILIGEPETFRTDGHVREIMILGGAEAQTWLRHARKAKH